MEVIKLPLNTFEIESKSSHASSIFSVATSEKISISADEERFPLTLPEDVFTYSSSSQSFHLTVPPTTPAPRYSFGHVIESLPKPFPKVDNLKIPYIREVGIKTSLDHLSQHFSCPNYKLNPIQFWFLDVIADCLWQMQDEFQFPVRYQKVILEWVLYAFDLIRDPQKNLTRKDFFQIFNEAVDLANEKIEAGCDMLPSPQEVFFLQELKDDMMSYHSQSDFNSSDTLVPSGQSYLAVGVDESVEVFPIPEKVQQCHKREVVSTTSTETKEEETIVEEENIFDFYEADMKIPDRFLSSSSSSEEILSEETDDKPLDASRFLWKRSSLSSDKLKAICSLEKFKIEKVADSEDGSQGSHISEDNIRQKWKEYLEDRHNFIEEMERNMMINSCVLYAIKQFIYDYFHETFQFKVVKLSLINHFTSITQHINRHWFVPKVLKEELKKPKPAKEKKKKKKKPKKPRKKTKAKKRKDKKKKKPKKKKKDKKSKKPKKKKLTKEEKEELARLKREQARLEEELRIAEENRRLLFPLKEAADDDFFKSIFDHWVKPKEKKKKKDKKGKGKKRK